MEKKFVSDFSLVSKLPWFVVPIHSGLPVYEIIQMDVGLIISFDKYDKHTIHLSLELSN